MNQYRPDISRRYAVSSIRSPLKTGSRPKKTRSVISIIIIVLVLAAGFAYYGWHLHSSAPTKSSIGGRRSASPSFTSSAPVNYCAGNTLNQLILVSISQRHLWACSAAKVLYSSPVVTGVDYLAADLTPPGTYHIYAK